MLMWICRVFISEWEWEIERTSTNSVFFNVYGAVSFFMIYLEKSRITFSGVPITSKFSHRLRTTELTYLVYCVGLGWAERFGYRKLTLIATLWKLSKLSIYFFFPSKLTHVPSRKSSGDKTSFLSMISLVYWITGSGMSHMKAISILHSKWYLKDLKIRWYFENEYLK